MIRTAEQWINEVTFVKDGLISVEAAAKAINGAQVEAIKEAASAAKITWDRGHIYIESAYIDRQSILKLIDQIK